MFSIRYKGFSVLLNMSVVQVRLYTVKLSACLYQSDKTDQSRMF